MRGDWPTGRQLIARDKKRQLNHADREIGMDGREGRRGRQEGESNQTQRDSSSRGSAKNRPIRQDGDLTRLAGEAAATPKIQVRQAASGENKNSEAILCLGQAEEFMRRRRCMVEVGRSLSLSLSPALFGVVRPSLAPRLAGGRSTWRLRARSTDTRHPSADRGTGRQGAHARGSGRADLARVGDSTAATTLLSQPASAERYQTTVTRTRTIDADIKHAHRASALRRRRRRTVDVRTENGVNGEFL